MRVRGKSFLRRSGGGAALRWVSFAQGNRWGTAASCSGEVELYSEGPMKRQAWVRLRKVERSAKDWRGKFAGCNFLPKRNCCRFVGAEGSIPPYIYSTNQSASIKRFLGRSA